MKQSGIDYVDAPWGPWRGCTPVSEGCRNCYARREMEDRWKLEFSTVRRASDASFYKPLHIEKPTRFFVCPWGDFFHEAADDWRGEAFEVISKCSRHTFVIVTKRPERMIKRMYGYRDLLDTGARGFLRNVWFLVSVENQATADERIPELLRLRDYGYWPVLGVSYEPALGPVDFDEWMPEYDHRPQYGFYQAYQKMMGETPLEKPELIKPGLDWIVMGGESGPGARPMHPDWVRQTRDDCAEAGVPFWFKQWGEYAPARRVNEVNKTTEEIGGGAMHRVGRKAAGDMIDGKRWKQLPEGFGAEK